MQKEFKQLLGAIQKWVEVNKGEVSFIGSFISFDHKKIERDEEDIFKDEAMVAFGGKGEMKLALKELQKNLKKEKDFVNW